MDFKECYIYKTTNLINGKIYIGQRLSYTKRRGTYLGSGINIKRAIKKYGRENFVREILINCNSQQELNEYEELYINLYSSTNPEIGYNILTGASMKMDLCDPITREKHSKQMSLNSKGKLLGNKNYMYGRTHSDEIKKKLSDINKGENNYWWGKKRIDITERQKGKNNPFAQAVEIYNPVTGETIQKFGSISEGAEYINRGVSNISSCLRGKSCTAGGYYWRYSNPEKEITIIKKLTPKDIRRPIEIYDPITLKIIEQFKSVSDLARKLNTRSSAISRVLLGKRKRHKGYYVRYSK